MSEMAIVPTAQAGMVQRQEFSGSELAVQAETASTALAAQAKAQVEARYIMALQRPRDILLARQRILDECKRPGFAESAMYAKPVGGSRITGLSIRFAEAAARHMRNILPETRITWDDSDRRIVNITVTDLEANLTYSQDIVITKTVERTKLRDGQVALKERTNSSGRKTFIVESTEDELATKQAAQVSKVLRTLLLRLVPGDIQDEAMAAIQRTQQDKDAKDPQAAQKSLVDAFQRYGVTVPHLVEYLGHPIDTATPDEIAELRSVGTAIKDRETTWTEALEAKKAERGETATAGETAPKSRTDALKQKLGATGGKAADKPAETKRDANAEVIIAHAAKAKNAADIERLGKSLDTYRETMPADDVKACESALSEAEQRLGL